MRGDLVETTAADVCRELAAQGASGILAIDGPDGPGRIVFREGRIIAAVSPTPRARLGDRLVGAGELDPEDLASALEAQRESGEAARLGSLLVERGLVRRDAVRVFVQEQVLDALFEVIRWPYGDYAFNPDDQDPQQGVPLSLSVDDALVEVSRRQQEWDELSQVIPDLEAVPSFRSGAATASASLEPDEFAVLASVDGERSVRSLAADLGYGEFEAARIVYGLSLLGIVDVSLPRDEIGAALEDALGIGDVEDAAAADAVDDDVQRSDQTAGSTSDPTDDVTAALAEQAWAEEDFAAPAGSADDADEPEVWVASDDPEPDTAEVEFEFEVDAPSDVDAPSEVAAATQLDAPSDVDAASDQGEAPPPPQAPAPPSEPPPGSSIVPPASSRPADEPEADDDRPAQARATRADEPGAGRRSGLGRGLAAIIPGVGGGTDERQRDDDQDVATHAQDAAPPPPPVAPAEHPADVREADEPQEVADSTGDPAEVADSADGVAPEQRDDQVDVTDADVTEPAAEVDDVDALTDAPKPSPQRGDDNDVSEFLRELSRLSIDSPKEPGAPRPPSRPAPPPTSPSSPSSSSESEGSSKKKRRGLFGRG